jgi:hypothetical protein
MPPRTLTITRPYAVGGSAPERTDRRGLHNPGQSIATAIALLGFPIAAVTGMFGLATVAVVGTTAAFAKRQDGVL